MFNCLIKYLFLSMLFSSIIFGQNDFMRYAIGVSGGYSQFNINNIIELSNQGNGNYEKNQGGITINGNFSYSISESILISIVAGYNYSSNYGKGSIIRTTSASPDIIGVHEYKGQYKTKLIPISLRFLYKSNFSFFNLNYGIGVNYYFGEISLANNFINPVQVEAELGGLYKLNNKSSGSGVGFSLIVEPELLISKNWSIISEINYTYGNVLSNDAFSNKCQISINGVSLRMGMNYYF